MLASYFDYSQVNACEKLELKGKCEINATLNEQNGCLLWCRSCNSAGYPQMKLGKTFSNRFVAKPFSPVHIAYSMEFNVVLNKPNYEISHLCHNKKCINVYHVNYETNAINASRQACCREQKCYSHYTLNGSEKNYLPACMFWWAAVLDISTVPYKAGPYSIFYEVLAHFSLSVNSLPTYLPTYLSTIP